MAALPTAVHPLARAAGRFYRPQLDGLRFMAFFAVFVAHTTGGAGELIGAWGGISLRAGVYGVDLFFLLSAYLVTELLLREGDLTASESPNDPKNRINLRAFWLRRILRIWPLYYTFLFTAPWLFPLLGREDTADAAYLAAYAFFVGNWACAARGFPKSPIGPLWSVSIEEQFYVAWPLLIRWIPRFRLVYLFGGMIGVAFLTRWVQYHSGTRYPGTWCSTLSRLDPLALGGLIALLLHGRERVLGLGLRLGLLISGLASWILVSRYAYIDNQQSAAAVVLGLFMVGIGSSAMLLGALGTETILGRFFGNRLIVYLGRISYGLYVFHGLSIAVIDRFGPSGREFSSLAIRKGFAMALTILLAAVSYRWIERPFLRLKDRFTVVASRP